MCHWSLLLLSSSRVSAAPRTPTSRLANYSDSSLHLSQAYDAVVMMLCTLTVVLKALTILLFEVSNRILLSAQISLRKFETLFIRRSVTVPPTLN